MQELASAFKYNEDFFNTLKNAAAVAMDSTSKTALNTWLRTFSTLNTKVKMRIEDFQNSEQGDLAKALMYAAEAYHTRGAIRHIVGATQMKVIDPSLRTSLSTNDLWVSMIENWGESIKEYNHCKEISWPWWTAF
ncbi:hypothetical protein ACROYT_G013856 [Oculina patagonica]